jgi:methionyl aminopeptidase
LFHTAPNVPHYAKNKAVGMMHPGQTFTIEPMVNAGNSKDFTWPDDWTAVVRSRNRHIHDRQTMHANHIPA